jgi:hypothetical protein
MDSAEVAAAEPLETLLRVAFVPRVTADAAIGLVVFGASGDRAVTVKDQTTGACSHRGRRYA